MHVCVYAHAFLIACVEGVGICGNLKEIQILSDQVGRVKNNFVLYSDIFNVPCPPCLRHWAEPCWALLSLPN